MSLVSLEQFGGYDEDSGRQWNLVHRELNPAINEWIIVLKHPDLEYYWAVSSGMWSDDNGQTAMCNKHERPWLSETLSNALGDSVQDAIDRRVVVKLGVNKKLQGNWD